jgi:oxygen-independent coproporphyrinogen-3 oxidase
MRCGFCNLFTSILPAPERVQASLHSLLEQARQVADAIQPQKVVQAAIGGGTPSFLDEAQLEQLFTQLAQIWPLDWQSIPVSFEASPATLSPSKLRLLKDLGVTRLSLGVQSFVPEDLAQLKRPQDLGQVLQVCQWIRDSNFPQFNLDLIYGNESQTSQSWRTSLLRAIEQEPDQLYLYPLYVGKLTRLDHLGRRPGQRRQQLYQEALPLLQQAGYQAQSMRLFSKDPLSTADYCCQDDGMVGLGPGARSYTREVHYSSEYAVGQPGVRAIIEAFDQHPYHLASYGYQLDDQEQRRRWVIKSLLRATGMDIDHYQQRFHSHPLRDLPQLQELLDLQLAQLTPSHLQLNAQGLAQSDTIGPWLYSAQVQQKMQQYELH